MVNLHAPNNDDPMSDEVIIGGDYNLVLDVEKDEKGGLAKTHKKPLEVINSYTVKT